MRKVFRLEESDKCNEGNMVYKGHIKCVKGVSMKIIFSNIMYILKLNNFVVFYKKYFTPKYYLNIFIRSI